MTFTPDRIVQAERTMHRQQAMTEPCRYCNAQPGQECFNRTTGLPVDKIPAHMYRMQDAGL